MSSAIEASLWRPVLDRVATILDELGATGWIVGGSLRDAVIGLPVRDIDLAVTVDPLLLARQLAPKGIGGLAQLRRGTVRVALQVAHDAHLDLTLVQGNSIEEDLALRDFRINALALPLAARDHFLGWLQRDGESSPVLPSELVDPFAGVDDLFASRLDVVSARVFRDDPGRILRGARLAAHLNLTATPQTITLARTAASYLADLPDDRTREELNLLLALPSTAKGLELLRDMQALPALFMPTELDTTEQSEIVWEHMVASLGALRWLYATGDETHDAIYARIPLEQLQGWYAATVSGEIFPRSVALGWATQLHALTPHEQGHASATPGRQTLAMDVQIIRGLPSRVRQALKAWHDAQMLILARNLDEVAIRQFFDRLGHGGESARDALMVAFACMQAQASSGTGGTEQELERVADNLGHILTEYFDDPNALMPPNLIDGAQVIQELGIGPGPLVGRILREIRGEQLAGNVSTMDDALAYARKIVADAL
jgi:poly(A) polymerase